MLSGDEHTLGPLKSQTFDVTITGSRNSRGFCEIQSAGFYLDLIVLEYGETRKYSIAISNKEQDDTQGFKRLLPTSTSVDADVLAVEISHNVTLSESYATTLLRLVKTDPNDTFGRDSTCIINVYERKYGLIPLTILPYNVSASITPTSQIAGGQSTITQQDGKVGIGTDTPEHTLDVLGAANVSGTLAAGNISTSGNAAIEGTLTTGTLNFGNKWRLTYNEIDNSLEIQHNTATSGAANWVQTSILAIM